MLLPFCMKVMCKGLPGLDSVKLSPETIFLTAACHIKGGSGTNFIPSYLSYLVSEAYSCAKYTVFRNWVLDLPDILSFLSIRKRC